MAERPRILLLDGAGQKTGDIVPRCSTECDVVRVDSPARALAMLRSEHFDAILAAPLDAAALADTPGASQAQRVLDALADGVAVVDSELRVTWANPVFEAWCNGPAVGRGFYDALHSPEILGPDYSPFHNALSGKPVITRLHCRGNRYLEFQVSPAQDGNSPIFQFISLGRDVTSEVLQQQKLDALHRAGRELAALPADQLAEMSVAERIELLKRNILQYTHNLLHYDVIEIRLLDRQTNRLEPLLEEGMTQEASRRVLHAEAKGNGVTGFVAATGKSYLCPDTATDPLYIEGAAGARSSLTVPLICGDQVIGTFNVESPKLSGFGEEDLQFAEIFSREIANAIHTLELLVAEKRSSTEQSIDAVNRAVALPVDMILAAATTVLDRWIGHEPEMADKLREILNAARSIKQHIQKVGTDLAPTSPSAKPPVVEHPRLKEMRILVADNDERVRRSAHGILGRWGCIVETARDGQEALTMARLGSYDAILADIRLPDMSGYDVYRGLREAQPTARVILMSAYGYDASHSIVKARQDGLRFVLFKPFRVDQMLAALESADPPSSTPPQPETARA